MKLLSSLSVYSEAPVHITPNCKKPYKVAFDASGITLGAICCFKTVDPLRSEVVNFWRLSRITP